MIPYARSKGLFSLILSKYSRLKVPYLSRKCLLFMLLMICGDVERLPGQQVMEHFSNTRGIKKIHQNIKGLLTNIGSLTLLLNTYKNIDIITLSETHITYGSWKDSSGLYAIPGFTFISKCCQNGE